MPEGKKHKVALRHKTVDSWELDYMFSDTTKMPLFIIVMFLNTCHLRPTISISCVCENWAVNLRKQLPLKPRWLYYKPPRLKRITFRRLNSMSFFFQSWIVKSILLARNQKQFKARMKYVLKGEEGRMTINFGNKNVIFDCSNKGPWKLSLAIK